MVGPKTFEEWAEAYEERSGERVDPIPSMLIAFDKDKGFMTYIVDERRKVLLICHVCGDGKHWKNKTWEIFNQLQPYGFTAVEVCTMKNPKLFHRYVGGEHVRTETVENIVEDTKEVRYFFRINPLTVREIDKYGSTQE
jgi:hypothetical protein